MYMYFRGVHCMYMYSIHVTVWLVILKFACYMYKLWLQLHVQQLSIAAKIHVSMLYRNSLDRIKIAFPQYMYMHMLQLHVHVLTVNKQVMNSWRPDLLILMKLGSKLLPSIRFPGNFSVLSENFFFTFSCSEWNSLYLLNTKYDLSSNLTTTYTR